MNPSSTYVTAETQLVEAADVAFAYRRVESGSGVPRDAQYDATMDWGTPDHSALQRLGGIATPTLVVQGDNDLMIPTKVGHFLAGLIPDALLRIWPDAAHAFLFQYPAEVADVNEFLARAA